jgi:hypothetical protein
MKQFRQTKFQILTLFSILVSGMFLVQPFLIQTGQAQEQASTINAATDHVELEFNPFNNNRCAQDVRKDYYRY